MADLRSMIYGAGEHENEPETRDHPRTTQSNERKRPPSEDRELAEEPEQKRPRTLETSSQDESESESPIEKSGTASEPVQASTNSSKVFAATSTATAGRLQALYDTSSLSAAQSIDNNLWPTATLPSRPRGPKIMYQSTGRPPADPKPDHYASLETIAIRQAKERQQYEWTEVRKEWKKRKYDLRGEVDVGGAVEYMARRAWQSTRRQCRQEQKPRAVPIGNDLHKKPDASDTSDEEQDSIMNRLLNSSQEAQPKIPKENEDAVDLRPYAERLDYYELGRSAPRLTDLEFSYTQSSRCSLDRSKRKKTKTNLTEANESSVTLKKSVREAKAQRRLVPPRIFPLTHTRFAGGRFLHFRQLRAMTARHIVGSAGSLREGSLEDRLLRAMWNRETAVNHRLALLLTQVDQLGRSLQCFLQHNWKDRLRAALRLGVIPNAQQSGTGLLGCTLEPQSVLQASREDRARIVREESVGRIAWSMTALETDNLVDDMDMLTPATTYTPVPVSAPPIPSFPLDISGVLFGPSGKHTHVWHNGPVFESLYNLTLSSLLSRRAMAHLEGEADVRRELEDSIESMLEEAVKVNANQFYKRLWQQSQPIAELPLGSFYQAVTGYCSFMSNGCPRRNERFVKDKSDDISDYWDSEDEQVEQVATIDEASKRMFDFCQPLMENNGLLHFSRLHVTFGILRLSKMLPESAVDILSRPLDNQRFRTPFDIIRCLLEHLEEKQMLIDSTSSSIVTTSPPPIHVGELEYAFHEAATIFGRCVERDPTEANHHAWYIGTLAGSLLLCSGNRIGSGAHIHPSAYVVDKARYLLESLGGDESNKLFATHEVRRMLPKFQELRRKTAHAFQLLSQLEKHQSSTRAHLAVSSFLEWRQVIALLIGPVPDGKSSFEQVRLLHEQRSVQWALQEQSSLSLDYLKRRDASLDDRLDGHASALEREPNQLKHWRALVHELGPIGADLSGVSGTQCTHDCKECSRVLDGFFVDHCSLKRRQLQGCWWGESRHDWWDTQLLNMPCSNATWSPEDISAICTALEDNQIPSRDVSASAPDATDTRQRNENARDTTSWQWLETALASPAPDVSQPDEVGVEIRNKNYDAVLPTAFLESMKDSARTILSPTLASSAFKGNNAHTTELWCLKLVITCHLYGLIHPSVENSVVRLLEECWHPTLGLDKESNSYRALAWLYSVRLNIPVILRSRQSAPQAPGPYSNEMKQSVKDGVELFGRGKWKKIFDHYDVFRGYDPWIVRVIFNWMVKNGEMDLQAVNPAHSNPEDDGRVVHVAMI